jgi:hypothetical protein
MSRFRLGSIAAFAGILITTGGCAGSATAPEAATVRGTPVSQDRATNPTTKDGAAEGRGNPGSTGADEFSVSSGWLTGGG